jgi:hypothetical protein
MKNFDIRIWANCWQPQSQYIKLKQLMVDGHNNFQDCFDYLFNSKLFTPQVFSGLLDKNGKKIYEGDILEEGKDLYICEFLVKFSHSYFAMMHIRSGWHFGGNCNRMEIVGNNFENPGLLDGYLLDN